jgi:hypothetical protein
MVIDIALGKQDQEDEKENLAAFAKTVNASWMDEWMELGYYEEGEFEGWGGAFDRVMELTLQRGGRIHFNLTGIDIQDALAGDPSIWVGRYTAWELQQVVLRLELFDITSFYLNGKRLSVEDVEALGIVRPQRAHDPGGVDDDRDI